LNPFPLWHFDAVAGRGRPSHYFNLAIYLETASV
jgi:hypothetical protein